MGKHLMIGIVLASIWAGGAAASLIRYEASLSGAAEATPNDSPGTGTALVDYDSVFETLRVQVTFSGLTGLTTAAHIHCCTALPDAGTAGVATTTPNFLGFPIGVTAGIYDITLDLTSAGSFNPAFVTAQGGVDGARAALIGGLDAGRAYLNIHTNLFPGGEIRGFLTAVPTSSTVSFLALGVGLLTLRRRSPQFALAAGR